MKKLIAIAVLVAILVAGCVNQSSASTAKSEVTVHDNVNVEVIQGDYIGVYNVAVGESLDVSANA